MKAFTLRLPPELWLEFRKWLLDNNTSAQQWFTAQVQQALKSYLQEKKEEK